jgi:hypothetical protein
MPPGGVKKGTKRARQYEHIKESHSGRRGGQRSGSGGPKGRTRDQLHNEAKKLGIEGRSNLNKRQLQRAVDSKKS